MHELGDAAGIKVRTPTVHEVIIMVVMAYAVAFLVIFWLRLLG